MTADYRNASIRARQQNITRYCRLLATQLTVYEREYVHRRIAEERAELERLLTFDHSVAPIARSATPIMDTRPAVHDHNPG
jgi:hypothetical protein